MASIQQYRAQVGIQPPSRPSVRITNPMGEALQQTGAAVVQLGSDLLDRKQRRESFKADTDWRRLNAEMDRTMFAMQKDAPEDGTGLHDDFMEVYNRQTEDFLAGLPQGNADLMTRMQANVELGGSSWSLNAAKSEYATMTDYQTTALDETFNSLATQIGLNPEAYETFLQNGFDSIESSSLPPAAQAKLTDMWEQTAMAAEMNERVKTDPVGLLLDLGQDVRGLPVNAQGTLLLDGLSDSHQYDLRLSEVRRLAEASGDTEVHAMTSTQLQSHLENTEVARAYATELLREAQKEHGADTEAVMKAYFGTDDEAAQWMNGVFGAPNQRNVTANSTDLIWRDSRTGEERAATPEDFGSVDPSLLRTVREAFAAQSLGTIKFTSAERGGQHNEDVGGAGSSRHVIFDERIDPTTGEASGTTGHTGALDIAIPANMKVEDKLALLRRLSSMGIEGIGVYSNSIHVDLGGRRMWGSSHGSDSIPRWAEGFKSEHMNGTATTAALRNVNDRYTSLDYDTSQAYINDAASIVSDTSPTTSVSELRAVSKDMLDRQIAQIEATGTGVDGMDEDQVLATLTADSRRTYRDKLHVSKEVFRLTDNIDTMGFEQLRNLVNGVQAQPNQPDLPTDVAIRDKVVAEVDQLQRDRRDDPAAASLSFGTMQEQWATTVQINGEVNGDVMQSWIENSLAVQRDHFNISPEDAKPLPDLYATEIAARIGDVTRVGDAAQRDELTKSLVTRMYAQYGDYTDEVIMQALGVLEGATDKGSPEGRLIGYMSQLERGRLPDWLQSTISLYQGNTNDPSAPPANVPVSTAAPENTESSGADMPFDEKVRRLTATLQGQPADQVANYLSGLADQSVAEAARQALGSN